jgi:hypothetical protein
LIRSEPERTYLLHQARALRQLHDGPLEVVRDRLATDGYYDNERLRIRSDHLMRAYELLYPRDERRLSEDVLALVGQQGLACLWSDRAVVRRGAVILALRRSHEEAELLQHWLQGMELEASLWPNRQRASGLRFRKPSALKALELVRPLLHPSMKLQWREFR